jgi:hypothetical protein
MLDVIVSKIPGFGVVRNNEKRKRDRFSLCLTPISQLKYPVV